MRRKLPIGMCLIILALCLFAGCTLVHTFSLLPVEYPVAERIQLSVNLRLTDEFCGAKYDRRGERIEYGESLCQNAQGLAQATFNSVTVARGSSPVPVTAAEAHLTPVVVLIDRNEPMWASSEQTTTVSVEWTFSDASTGRVIWVNTFTGEGKGPKAPGMSRQEGAKVQAAALLKELFGTTRSALLSSPEIREFASRPGLHGTRRDVIEERATAAIASQSMRPPDSQGGGALGSTSESDTTALLVGRWEGRWSSRSSFRATGRLMMTVRSATGSSVEGAIEVQDEPATRGIQPIAAGRVEGDEFVCTVGVATYRFQGVKGGRVLVGTREGVGQPLAIELVRQP